MQVRRNLYSFSAPRSIVQASISEFSKKLQFKINNDGILKCISIKPLRFSDLRWGSSGVHFHFFMIFANFHEFFMNLQYFWHDFACKFENSFNFHFLRKKSFSFYRAKSWCFSLVLGDLRHLKHICLPTKRFFEKMKIAPSVWIWSFWLFFWKKQLFCKKVVFLEKSPCWR